MEIFIKRNFLWKLSDKANCCVPFQKKLFFPTKQINGDTFQQGFFVEIFQLNKVLWKCSNKATVCGNFPTKPVVVEIFQPSKVLWKFSIKATFFVEICHRDFFGGN